PAVASSTAGQVLTAQANGTGQVEFSALPPTLYTGNGTIPVNRGVTIAGGATLDFGGTGNFLIDDTLHNVDLRALTTVMLGTKSAGIGSFTNLAILTPNALKNATQIGQVLTLQGLP